MSAHGTQRPFRHASKYVEGRPAVSSRCHDHSCQSAANFAVVHNGPHEVVAYGRQPRGGLGETALHHEP
jgi:hypothetical protein